MILSLVLVTLVVFRPLKMIHGAISFEDLRGGLAHLREQVCICSTCHVYLTSLILPTLTVFVVS